MSVINKLGRIFLQPVLADPKSCCGKGYVEVNTRIIAFYNNN